jgi:glycosyltransferase involved in cell wall biosynthesis
MKNLILYAYPPEADGQSLQGDFLRKGILEAGEEAIPCHFKESYQKEFYLKYGKPDVAFGIGFWGNVPDVIIEPLKHGVTPVPWFNADGWIANYKKEFNDLDLMFTTSSWVKDLYRRDGIDVSKIIPMHIGIDTGMFKPLNNTASNNGIRKMLGINETDKIIMTIGGDTTSKGSQEMMRALAEVNKEFKNWKYICKSWPSGCSREWREKEIELAEELGITDHMIFIEDEFTPEFMVLLLNAADIYAAPSRIEGFGMIQVEAMSCGKPVISINKMGPGETILHNKTGLLAEVAEEVQLSEEWAFKHMGFTKKHLVKFDHPKTFAYRADVNDLREHTLKLLSDDSLRETMGNQAREHVLKNFDYRDIAKRMLAITKEKLNIE